MRSKTVPKIKAIKAFPVDRWFTYSDVSHLGWLKPSFSIMISKLVKAEHIKRRLKKNKSAEFYISSKSKGKLLSSIDGNSAALYDQLLHKFLRA